MSVLATSSPSVLFSPSSFPRVISAVSSSGAETQFRSAMLFGNDNTDSGFLQTIAIAQGRTVTLIYGLVFIFLCDSCVAATLAALASVYPTAGGQYHVGNGVPFSHFPIRLNNS